MNREFAKVLITGASSGIGAACARRLADGGGYQLALTGRSQEKLGVVAERSGAVFSRAVDLLPPGNAGATVRAAAEALGGLDAVIHCAGVGLIKPIAETTDAEFCKVTNTNMRVTFLVAQEACEIMAPNKRGRFLTLPGILGKAPMKGASAYVASKYAVTGLMKTFALEYARQNIGISLFYFGGVDSPFWDGMAMNPQRDRMIPVEGAAAHIAGALESPGHLVLNEITLQPAGHQL